MATKEDTMTEALKIGGSLVGGGLVGAGLALLLAPQAGKETRKDLRRYARTLGRKTDAALYEFADSISDFTDTVGQKASLLLDQEMTDEAKKRMLAAIERGQAKLEKHRNRLAQLME